MNAAKRPGATQSEVSVSYMEARLRDAIWYTTCRRCKEKLRGTQAELRAHICGTSS